MIKQGCSAAIALLLFSTCTSAVGQQLSVKGRTITRSQCEPIGRVLSRGERHFTVGSLLCRGDHLNVTSGATVDVLCLLNGQILKFSGSFLDVSNKCVQQEGTRVRQACGLGRRSNCRKTKGPGEENTPEMISPYSSMLLNGRPFISWHSLQRATSYTVEVSGKGVKWQKVVKGTTLAYPSQQPAMQFGHAYKITILANQGDSAISASISVVNLLPESDAQLVLNRIKRIAHLNLPEDSAVFLDLDSIYMSKRLLTETIETLEARVKAGSQNPEIYRILGDRYLEVGLPNYAKPKYEIATKLARTDGNLDELAKAQEGLKAVQVALLNEEQRPEVVPWDNN